MNIREFRQKNPDYNDMSDNELADALYSKHYADMPREEFNTSFLGDNFKNQAVQTAQKEPTIPSWAKDYPTAYGLAATAANIGSPIAEALAGIGGTVAGAAGGIPTGPGAIATAAGTGALAYGATKNLTGALKQYLGVEQPQTPEEALKHSGTNLLEGAAMQVAPSVIQPVISKTAKGIGNIVKDFTGTVTGSGRESIKTSVQHGENQGFTPLENIAKYKKFDDPNDLQKAMSGDLTKDDIIYNAKQAFNVIKNKRANDYRSSLEILEKNTQAISDEPIHQELSNLLKGYGIKVETGLSPEYEKALNIENLKVREQYLNALNALNTNVLGEAKPPTVNFDKSIFKTDPEAQRVVKSVIEAVDTWSKDPENKNIMGFDLLKRQLDNTFSPNSAARQIVAKLRDSTYKTATDAVPEYGQMTKGYQEATNFMKDIDKTLLISGDRRHTSDQIIRRLTSSMRDNFEFRKEVLDLLSEQSGKDLTGQVAGYNLNKIMPQGLVGKMYGGGMMGGMILSMNKRILPLLGIASPRVVGEFMHTYGKALVEAKQMSPAAYNAMAYEIGKKLVEGENNGH